MGGKGGARNFSEWLSTTVKGYTHRGRSREGLDVKNCGFCLDFCVVLMVSGVLWYVVSGFLVTIY